MLEVRLLGQFEVRLDGRPIVIPLRSAQSLFAYLILTAGMVHRREKLAGLFWPDTTDAKGRDNLRHALWRIRKALSGGRPAERQYILTDEISITFDVQSDYWLDTSILERAASERATTTDLMELLALYRGELLPGFYDNWAALERERLQTLFEQEMQRLLDHLVQEQRWASVLEWGERWIAFGNTPEAAYRALMLAHSARGDSLKVASVYERCAQALHDDLGVEPSEQTRFLYERLTQAGRDVYGWQAPPSPMVSYASDSLAVASPATPFVGREQELARLDGLLDEALAGRGQVIFIAGEAGSGKTALAQTFAIRAQAAHTNLLVTIGTCSAYAGIGDPYLPFREVLSWLAGDVGAKWVGGPITQENANRLRSFTPIAARALVEVGPNLIDSFVSGADLLARATIAAPRRADWLEKLDALVARHGGPTGSAPLEQSRIFEQYCKVLLALAAHQSLVLILDDLHWADVSSVGLLFHLGRRISRSRILLVGTYRPEEVARRRDSEPHPLQGVLREIQRVFGETGIDLDRSTPAERREFVDALLDVEPNRLNPKFRQALLEQTEGHALFTTELIRDLRERGDLRPDENGVWVEQQTLDWAAVPTRVEAVIEQRIERMRAELQLALRVASVEGEEFTAEVIARVQNLDDQLLVQQLSHELDRQHRLVSTQDFKWLGSQRLSRYKFRHHLFQAYIYQSLDATERAYLHAAVGHALEQLHVNQTAKIAVQLARHFQAAGIVDKAVDYLSQAGEQAARLSANHEAIGHFQQGLALLANMPNHPDRAQRELALQIALGNALTATKGYAAREVGQAYTRARELCRQIGETPQLVPVLNGLGGYYLNKGEAQIARELEEQVLDLAQKWPIPAGLLAQAHHVLGATLWFMGEFAEAQPHFEQGIALYHTEESATYLLLNSQDPGLACLQYAAWALWFLGYPDRALKRNEEMLTMAQQLAHPFSRASALVFAAGLYQFRHEAPRVQQWADDVTSLSSKHDFPYWSAIGQILRGWALAEQGTQEAGIAEIQEGLSNWRGLGIEMGRTYFLALLAEAYQKAGQVEEGLSVIAEALSAKSDIGGWVEAELYRLEGELLLQRGKIDAVVEQCYWQAINIARQQNAKSLELRATVSLSRLWRAQGKPTEARTLLAQIYNWFREGFDQADLKEAQTLLQQLAVDIP